VYDLLRSKSPADFLDGATCVAQNVTATQGSDAQIPAQGRPFFYLVRADSACAGGIGSLGADSDGTPRAGRSCL
jgi:hypothetical protein